MKPARFAIVYILIGFIVFLVERVKELKTKVVMYEKDEYLFLILLWPFVTPFIFADWVNAIVKKVRKGIMKK